jgi:phosphoribosylformimino-5-aminoimidazole carboxamide ribotide isomerase
MHVHAYASHRYIMQDELVELLGNASPIPATYAGGVRNMEDLDRVKVSLAVPRSLGCSSPLTVIYDVLRMQAIGKGRVDISVGSALDIFGGSLSYKDVVAWSKRAECETCSP